MGEGRRIGGVDGGGIAELLAIMRSVHGWETDKRETGLGIPGIGAGRRERYKEAENGKTSPGREGA